MGEHGNPKWHQQGGRSLTLVLVLVLQMYVFRYLRLQKDPGIY